MAENALALNSQRQSAVLPRFEWGAALALTGVAIWLHGILFRHAGALWRDEVNLINLASSPVLSDLTNDSFPVLMPALVRLWMALGLGESDAGLRILGGAIGLGLLGALWIAARMMRRSPPSVALALLALNPAVIVYGDSLRAYGLGSLLVVLLAATVWALLERPSRARTALAIIVAVLSVQALYQNAVLVAAVCAGAWIVCWRRREGWLAWRVLGIGLTAALSLLLYAPKWGALAKTGEGLRSGFELDFALTSLSTVVGFPAEPYLVFWGLVALLLVAAAALRLRSTPAVGIADADQRRQELQVFCGASLLAGLVGFVGFNWWAALPSQLWYFLPPVAFAAVCLDGGLPPVHKLMRLALPLFVVLTGLMSALVAPRMVKFRFTNVDLLAQAVSRDAAPGDFVVVSPWFCGLTFERYFRGQTPWATIPPLPEHRFHRYDLVREAMQTTNAIQPVFEQMAAALQARRRVWMICRTDIPARGAPPPKELGPAPLKFSGWSDAPYNYVWAQQVAHFLANHANEFVELPPPKTTPVNPEEWLRLFVAGGWTEPRLKPPGGDK